MSLFAAHAAGIAAIEAVYPTVKDEAGLATYAARAAHDGFTGMMALHPLQVPIINAAFTPTAAQIEQARAIVAAFHQAPNAGVLMLEGKMIDAPNFFASTQDIGAGGRRQMNECRTDWTRDEIAALFDLPFNDLMFEAQSIHRANFPRNEVQLSTLLSIKTGGCPEDCGYCSQSTEAESGLKATKLMDVQAVLQAAAQAKDHGSGHVAPK